MASRHAGRTLIMKGEGEGIMGGGARSRRGVFSPLPVLLSILLLLVLSFAGYAQVAQEITVVSLTDRVLVEDCLRFGLNLGGDHYLTGSVLRKQRVIENFEGSTYRQIYTVRPPGRLDSPDRLKVPEPWRQVFIGSRYVILSGPSQWTSGTLRDIRQIYAGTRGRGEQPDLFIFDRPVKLVPGSGVMLEAARLDEGYVGPLDDYWRVNISPQVGDLPPGSAGRVAGRMNGADSPAHIRFATHYHRYGDLNGTWHIHFWARAVDGRPVLEIAPDRPEWGKAVKLRPEPEWRKYELKLPVKGVPESVSPIQDAHLLWLFRVTGGEILIDDIEMWPEGDENPTAFRDDLIATLQKFQPGILRYLQMGGNTLRNTLLPPLQAHAYTSRPTYLPGPYQRKRKASYGLHQFYELCHHVGAEPWYSLPGTMELEEILQFMEYLGGDSDTEFGRLRVEMGQKEPWSQVFSRIHVEFGNEAWNSAPPYQAGGFNGPDYWRELIAAAKNTPYYRPNIIFHAGGQAASTSRNQRIIAHTPNADRLSVAPYLIPSLNQDDLHRLNTDEKFFRWAFAWPLVRSLEEKGAMFRNHQLVRESGLGLSIYEINHHTTSGDAPLEPRNRLVTSLGGGLNVINNMLLMLREHQIREQCLFSLAQHSYRARNIGQVRLWGTALSMRAGKERYRPTFLAAAAVNQVIAGNLIETIHQGAQPTFTATGVFSRRDGIRTINNIPALWSYGFADNNTRGLIVINLDIKQAHRIAVNFPEKPVGAAHSYLLTGATINASNEFEHPDPQVVLLEETIEHFTTEKILTIPAHSMLVLQWKIKEI